MTTQPPGFFARLGALVGFLAVSVIAGVLVTVMVIPVLAVSGRTASGAVGVFNELPDYAVINEQSQRNTLWGTRGGQPVVLAQVFDQNRQEVQWDQVSTFAKDAAVAAEDRRFWEHGGVDVAGITRAAINNITGSGGLQGASSITQQLVKQLAIQEAVNTLEGEEQAAAIREAQASTLERKLREAKLAIGLEKRYTKDEILLAYLNIAGFGGNTYGIESAAQQYYSTTAANLTIAQAASLLAIVQLPNDRNPGDPDNWMRNQTRRDVILDTMLSEKMIDSVQHAEAIATPVDATTVIVTPPRSGCLFAAGAKNFCDYVTEQVDSLDALGATPEERLENWRRGGYNLYTTIDLDQQDVAEAQLARWTPADESRFQLGSAVTTLQVGTSRILTMAQNKVFDNSGTGDPLTTTSVNFNSNKADGGSGGFQAGSTWKLFTLIDWVEKGNSLSASVDGTQKNYTNRMLQASCAPGNAPYMARNDGGGNRGRMSVLQATAGSVNAAYYDMASQLDLCDIRDVAYRMGVTNANPDLPLETYAPTVLGTDSVAPMSMVNAYATIANGGVLCDPIAVDRIVDSAGTELPGQTPNCRPVISPEVAATVAFTLQSVMTGGTGSASNPRDGTPLIGKTGTAEARHTWMIVASTKVASGVWVGNIVGQQDLRRTRVAGGVVASARWPIERAIISSLNQSQYGAGAARFPTPPRASTQVPVRTPAPSPSPDAGADD